VVAVLPPAFTSWLDEHPMGAPGLDPYGTPWLAAGRVPGCAPEGAPAVLAITEPSEGAVIWSGHEDDAVELRAELSGAAGDAGPVELVVDDEVVARSEWPYEALVELPRGDHEVHARLVERAGDGTPVETPRVRFSVR
jgi:hypothetical protein